MAAELGNELVAGSMNGGDMQSPNGFYSLSLQHFREHLDKLFAKGIGMLDIALNEAFNILSDVRTSLTYLAQTQDNRWGL